MTGKLFLGLGDDYEFNPKRAKAVAEVLEGDENPVSAGGLTLTRAGYPANSGTITASGSATENLSASFWLLADAAGGPISELVTTSIPSGSDATAAAAIIADVIGGINGVLATPSGAVVTVNLQGAGVIISIRMALDSAGGGGGQVDPTPGDEGDEGNEPGPFEDPTPNDEGDEGNEP